MSLHDLEMKIERKEARLAVIGLGYVGLPVACQFAHSGFAVLGVEIRKNRVELINKGLSPIEGQEPGLADLLSRVITSGKFQATTDYRELSDCDVVLIDVDTPVDENHIPRYDALRSALKSLGSVIKDGTLVIVESTIAPGTMKGLVVPLLEKVSGKKLNRDFFLGNCPERVMPGKLLQNLQTVSRVVGGMNPETAETMLALYRHVVKADLDPTDCITAELVKTVENAYRDVQIAFANEVALICEAVGGDVWKVRQLVNKTPFRHMHLPGSGVGGHCIPKDPWLLAHGVKDKGISLRLIPAAREMNDSMPFHVMELFRRALISFGKDLPQSRVLVLGFSYQENSDDVRNSPSETLVRLLERRGAEVVIHDPYVQEFRGDLYSRAEGCDGAIVMVKHDQYFDLDLASLKSELNFPLIIDGRGLINEQEMDGWLYLKVGRASNLSMNREIDFEVYAKRRL